MKDLESQTKGIREFSKKRKVVMEEISYSFDGLEKAKRTLVQSYKNSELNEIGEISNEFKNECIVAAKALKEEKNKVAKLKSIYDMLK